MGIEDAEIHRFEYHHPDEVENPSKATKVVKKNDQKLTVIIEKKHQCPFATSFHLA